MATRQFISMDHLSLLSTPLTSRWTIPLSYFSSLKIWLAHSTLQIIQFSVNEYYESIVNVTINTGVINRGLLVAGPLPLPLVGYEGKISKFR
jgi:hypothetical protein